jgi:hypothetical protein
VPRRPIYPYTNLIWSLLGALDRGLVLDADEVRAHIAGETLLAWLETAHGLDTSFFGGDSLEGHEAVDLFQRVAATHGAFGLEHNGTAMVLAYCVEAIQQLVGHDD